MKIPLVSLLSVLALSAVACGGSVEASPMEAEPSSAAAPAAEASPDAGACVPVAYWCTWTNADMSADPTCVQRDAKAGAWLCCGLLPCDDAGTK